MGRSAPAWNGDRSMRATDTRDLTVDQQARLAYVLTIIRSTQSLRGWSQYRHPPQGEPHTVRLLKRVRGRLVQVYNISERDARTNLNA